MVNFLIKHLIPHSDQTGDPAVREAYGTLAGCVGICLNVLLFVGKFVAGSIVGSIAVTADAFNNLSDAGSSLITLFGFRLAGKRPHSDHPFGHGRIEYVAGLIVSLLIILMGVTLARESLDKMLHPQDVTFSLLSAGILAASILVKLYMYSYNRALSKKLNSSTLKATATDSLSDACATLAVLISMIISHLTGLRIDGYAGILVALMILWGGFGAARDTISPLLGTAPDPEFVKKIQSIVRSCPVVTGMHDLVIHDYGAGRRMISLHAEVPANGDILATHDAIDLVERRLHDELNCHAVIHMDPVETDNAAVNAVRQRVLEALHAQMDSAVSIHDFRMVTGPTHTNLIFDLLLPMDSPLTEEAAKKQAEAIVSALDPHYNAILTIDKGYV